MESADMSDLFRASAKARIGQQPPGMTSLNEVDEQKEEDNTSSGLQQGSEAEDCLSESSVSSAGTIKAGSIPNLFARPSRYVDNRFGEKRLGY